MCNNVAKYFIGNTAVKTSMIVYVRYFILFYFFGSVLLDLQREE